MYKPTPSQQKLFGVETQISSSLRKRLESSWTQLFKLEILPILCRNEDQYSFLYGSTDRPNFSVARLLGLCLLQEWNDLSDQEALDTFSFDIRWRYALDVTEDEVCRNRKAGSGWDRQSRRSKSKNWPGTSMTSYTFLTIAAMNHICC